MPPKPSCDCGKCLKCCYRTIKRASRLKQKTPLKRSSKPIARKIAVKVKRAKPRRGPMRDKGYRDWLRGRRCVACFAQKMIYRDRLCASGHGPIDPAHTVNNERGSKGPDSSCIPLCRHHHDEIDGRFSTEIITKDQFAVKYGLDLERESAAHFIAYTIWKETQP